MSKDSYTVKEYAKATGLSERTVYRWIKLGHLDTLQKMKFGKHVIPAYELPTYKREELNGN